MAEHRSASQRQRLHAVTTERSAALTDAEKLDRALDMVFVGPASTTEVLAAVFRSAAKRVGPEVAAELRLYADDLLGIRRDAERPRGRPAIDDAAALAAIKLSVSSGTTERVAISHAARRLAALDGQSFETHRHRLHRKLKDFCT